jgi:hypothetical protein
MKCGAVGGRDSQGPMFHFAWKLATLAKQAMARKLKNICDV